MYQNKRKRTLLRTVIHGTWNDAHNKTEYDIMSGAHFVSWEMWYSLNFVYKLFQYDETIVTHNHTHIHKHPLSSQLPE